MDLLVLGPVEALVDGRPIALGTPKQRAVLAMLALHVGHTVSTDRLAEGLWGEHPPPSAPKMVQLYVSHLRRLLDGNGAEIVTHGRGYELRLVDGDVDAVRFERLLDDGGPGRRSRCGAAKRWPTWSTSRSLQPRSGGSMGCDCTRTSWRSTRTSKRAGTAR